MYVINLTSERYLKRFQFKVPPVNLVMKIKDTLTQKGKERPVLLK